MGAGRSPLDVPVLGDAPNAELRTYNSPSEISYYRIGGTALVVQHLYALSGFDSPTEWIDTSSLSWQPLADHFDRVWSADTTMPMAQKGQNR
ncbi:MAG: hypothetical protein GY773_13220 [Actinomycetia bacterium]|nr:hypothetical protein [Actinomycetes bacterium]